MAQEINADPVEEIGSTTKDSPRRVGEMALVSPQLIRMPLANHLRVLYVEDNSTFLCVCVQLKMS